MTRRTKRPAFAVGANVVARTIGGEVAATVIEDHGPRVHVGWVEDDVFRTVRVYEQTVHAHLVRTA